MSKRAELEPKLCYFLLLKKTPNSIARLCSYAKPIFDAIGIQLDLRGLFQWVVSPDCFTHTPVPGAGPLNDHYAIIRLLLFANSDRKSTRLNSSHQIISYAVFCLKKKKNITRTQVIT